MPSNRTRLMLKTIALTVTTVVLLAAVGGYVVWRAGWYDIGATNQHWQAVHSLLEGGMRHSVARRSQSIPVPVLDDPRKIALGAAVFRDNCAQCHGAPGVAQHDLGKSMQPVPGPLIDVSRRWQPAQLYYITRHGIKMSGMPAWEFHLSEAELWGVVAFMQALPALSAPAYARLTQAQAATLQGERTGGQFKGPGNAERGRVALTQYACNACHIIPGVTGPRVYVGRPLDDVGSRKFIAGQLPNTQANLMHWIRNPKAVDPQTAMPDLDVTADDAADISAYLLSKR